MAEESGDSVPSHWVSMAMRVRHQWPHRNMLHKDLKQILMRPDNKLSDVSSLKQLSINKVLASDNLSWHLACTCPTGMFDYVMETLVKELAHRYRLNSGQRLQYNLTRSVVRLCLHCQHATLPLQHFLRQISPLFGDDWFRWSSCRYHATDDVAAMWAFYAELADAMAVGYVVPRLYEQQIPSLPQLDLSGIPRLRDSTWSLKTLCDAGNRELNPQLGVSSTLQLTMDLEIEGLDRKQLRLLHKLAMDRRKFGEGEEESGKFLVGFKHVYVTSLAADDWGTMIDDISAFPELCHVTLNMCSFTEDCWSALHPLAPLLTGLALTNNPDLRALDDLSLFVRLQELDLCNIDLRGLMPAITTMPTCLTYLGVAGCRLRAQELNCLATSRHVSSLLQLDVSENSAKGKPDVYQAYVDLFSALTSVSVLHVSHCHLADQEGDLKGAVEAALGAMVSLQLIAVSSTDFAVTGSLRGVVQLVDCSLFCAV